LQPEERRLAIKLVASPGELERKTAPLLLCI
jgi:hypothetical protein